MINHPQLIQEGPFTPRLPMGRQTGGAGNLRNPQADHEARHALPRTGRAAIQRDPGRKSLVLQVQSVSRPRSCPYGSTSCDQFRASCGRASWADRGILSDAVGGRSRELCDGMLPGCRVSVKRKYRKQLDGYGRGNTMIFPHRLCTERSRLCACFR